MRFIRIYIDGFGMFNNLEIGDFSPELNLILGPNEAGKSTILNFFRSVLFGFPSNRNAAERYEPVAGGTHGGRLEAIDESGTTYRIIRSPGRLLAGKLTIESDSGVLEEEEARKQLDRLLVGTHKDLFFNAFAFSLNELSRFDSLSGPEVADYIYAAAAGTGEMSLPRLIDETSGRQGELYKPRGQNPEINRLLRELAGIQSEINEAKNLPQRYTNLKADLEQLEKRAATIGAELGRLRQEERRLELIDRLRARAVRLDEVEANLKRRKKPEALPEGSLERLEKIERELDRIREDHERASVRLQSKRTELETLEIDEPLLNNSPEIEAIRDKGQLVQEKLHKLPDLEAESKALTKRASNLIDELGEAWDRERVAGFDTGLENRETIRRLWGEREARQKTVESVRSDLKPEQVEAERIEREIDDLRTKRQSMTGVKPSFPPLLSVGIPAILICGGIVTLLVLDTLIVPVILIVLGLIALQWTLSRRNRLVETSWLDSREAELRKGLERQSTAIDNLKEDLELREEDYNRSSRAWEEWLSAQGLPATWDRDSVFSLVERLQKIQDELKDMERKRVESAGYQERIEAFMAELNDLLGRLGRPQASSDDCGVVLNRLWQELKSSRSLAIKRAEIAESVKELETEATEAGAALERLNGSLEVLLKEAGVDQPSGLRQKAAEWEEFDRLEAERESLTRDLAGEAGGTDRLEALRASIRAEEPEAVEAELIGSKEEIESLETERAEINRTIGSLQTEIEAMEQNDRIADLRLREETIRAQLYRSSREWARLAVLNRLLQSAREKYERERQGTVLSQAARYFREMTGGRYRRVKKPLGEQAIRVETTGGRTVSTDRLSRGAAEQLYLALRFSLIEEYGRTAGLLPIVMDDILVNFDPERLKAAAKAILELAGKFQIILFTCHPHIVDGFRQLVADTPVIELPKLKT